MTRIELLERFLLHVEKERTALGLTQAEMAEKLGMSVSGYKKMIAGETSKIDLYIAYQMHLLTGKIFPELYGGFSEPVEILSRMCQLNNSQLQFINGIVDFELAFQDEAGKQENKDYINLLTLTGNQEDGMIFDSFNTEKLNVAPYRKRFGSDLHCALRINSDHLYPVYTSGDILLISMTSPRDGDTGIFTNKLTGRAYLRRLRQSKTCVLEPLNNFGIPIKIDYNNMKCMDEWIQFGRVLTKIRL